MKETAEIRLTCFNCFNRPRGERQGSAGRNRTLHDSTIASRPVSWESNCGLERKDSMTLTTVAATASSGSSSTMIPAFSIVSGDLQLQPGEETTKCFYFHTPNTVRVNIHKWVSDMTPGSHR